MKDTISLWSIRKAAIQDMWKLLDLGLILVLTTAIIPVCMMAMYVFSYGPIPSYLYRILPLSLLISMPLLSKAALDLVHNRKRDLFSNKKNLLKVLFIQSVFVDMLSHAFMSMYDEINHWYGFFVQLKENHYVESALSFVLCNGVFLLLFVILLYLAMCLQFASFYILEQHCKLEQAVRRSWLFSQKNRRLVLQLFLCEIAGVGLWILTMNYMALVEFNINLMILSVGLIMLLFTPIQVRMFKELEK